MQNQLKIKEIATVIKSSKNQQCEGDMQIEVT